MCLFLTLFSWTEVQLAKVPPHHVFVATAAAALHTFSTSLSKVLLRSYSTSSSASRSLDFFPRAAGGARSPLVGGSSAGRRVAPTSPSSSSSSRPQSQQQQPAQQRLLSCCLRLAFGGLMMHFCSGSSQCLLRAAAEAMWNV